MVEPLADEPAPVPVIGPAAGRDGDLFPYVYMRTWPEPSPEAQAQELVEYPYPLDGPPTGTFLVTLASLHTKGGPTARADMEQLAVAYIDGGVDTLAPFVRHPEALPGPTACYPAVYALVQGAGDQPPEETVAEIWTLLGMTPAGVIAFLGSEAYVTLRVQWFQSYFALVVELGYEPRLRDLLRRFLVVDHLLQALVALGAPPPTRALLAALVNASMVLPVGVFPLPPAGVSPPADGDGWIAPYAIGDLHLVKQRLRRYALGDLAYVESVMPGERRRSVRRRATRVTQTTTRLDARDTERASKAHSSSLTREASQAIADVITTTTYPDPGFSIKYGPTTTLSGGWTTETKPATVGNAPSRSDETSFAREIVDRAASRAAHRILDTRSETSSREAEESTTSEHDNRAGTVGRRGIYRWLNEVYEAYVVRYGNRFVLEVLLPSPAAPYVGAEADLPRSAFPPVPPAAIGIASFTDVRPDGFPALAARYPSPELELPPAPRSTVSGFARSGEPTTLPVPAGYEAAYAKVGFVLPPGQTSLTVTGIVGRTAIAISATATGVQSFELDGDTGAVPVLLQTSTEGGPVELAAAQLTVEIEANAGEWLLQGWGLRTFQTIQRSSEAQRGVYEGGDVAEGAPAPATPEPRHGYRAIERRELKRGTMELFFQRAGVRLGGTPAPAPEGIATPRYLQFFDRALEWSELSYQLLSAPKRAAGAKGAGLSGDARFLDFLEAAYAQILVPVSPAEAPRVLFFLASGMIWDGGTEGVAFHEADVALAIELKRLAPHARRRHPGERALGGRRPHDHRGAGGRRVHRRDRARSPWPRRRAEARARSARSAVSPPFPPSPPMPPFGPPGAFCFSLIPPLLPPLTGAPATSPVGTVVSYAGDPSLAVPPIEASGWMVCDGRALDKDEFDELFSVLGYVYSAQAGGQTFQIPDLRGQFLRGLDPSGSVDPDRASRVGANGEKYDGVGSLQSCAFQVHEHDLAAATALSQPSQSGTEAGTTTTLTQSTTAIAKSPSVLTSTAETRPTNVYVYFIVKVARTAWPWPGPPGGRPFP